MSEYKERYPDDSEDPPDVGLLSEDEAMGMEEIVSTAHRVILSRTSPAPPASKKAVLHGIKWGAVLALKGQVTATFSPGTATVGDIPFEVPTPAPHEVYCDICKKDLPTPKALRCHLRFHRGKKNYLCPRCGKHLASSHTFNMQKES